jgi:nucleoside-triphosphatase THEP1
MITPNLARHSMIAALQGAPSVGIQRLLGETAAKFARTGVRVGGVVEIYEPDEMGACGRLVLRDLATGELFPISQDLGPGSQSCNLDSRGVARACVAVEQALARGLDLVIISKFGKLEAARSGFYAAFQAATASETPMLTAVSPAMAEAWGAFSGPFSQYLPADPEAVETWWRLSGNSGLASAAE